jgi:hypothetical protein
MKGQAYIPSHEQAVEVEAGLSLRKISHIDLFICIRSRSIMYVPARRKALYTEKQTRYFHFRQS